MVLDLDGPCWSGICKQWRTWKSFVLSHARSPWIVVRQRTRLLQRITAMTIDEQDKIVGVRDDEAAVNADRADQLLGCCSR